MEGPSTKIEEVRADQISLFDFIIDLNAMDEPILFVVVGLKVVETELEIEGHDGTSFTTEPGGLFHRVVPAAR